jgi:hypothetical protein
MMVDGAKLKCLSRSHKLMPSEIAGEYVRNQKRAPARDPVILFQ